MLLSVVIPTCRSASALSDTLHSLARQTVVNFEVIVVSDGEDADTRALSESYSPDYPIRWIFHEQQLGLAATRNSGAVAASGELLAFLDDDTLPGADWLRQHMRHHLDPASGRGSAVCGPIMEQRSDPPRTSTDKHLQASQERRLREFQPVIEASGYASVGSGIERAIRFGVNGSIRRDVFLGSGGFNVALRHQDEEMELGHRLYLSGIRFFYEPNAIVRHRNTRNLTEHFRRSWRLRGIVDVDRVFELGQRNEQTQGLGAMHQGWMPGRLLANIFWRYNRPIKRLASGLERTANRTGSRLLAGAWARVSDKAEYWDGVRSKGCTADSLRQAAGGANAVLCLHSICEPQTGKEAEFYISPRKFHRFMQRFTAAGHRSVTLDQWTAGGLPAKHSLLTFDDGYDDLYECLPPAMEQHRLHPLIFLVAGQIGGVNVWDQYLGPLARPRNLLTLSQIREMQKLGVTFGSHTTTHAWLPQATDTELRREVGDSKRRLEDLLGVEITTFAYPFGGLDQRVRAAVAEAGYRMAFSLFPGLNWWNDPLCQNRADVRERTSLADFTLQLGTGCSMQQWAMAQVRTLGRELPSPGLRNAVRSLERTARHMQTSFSGRLHPQHHARRTS